MSVETNKSTGGKHLAGTAGGGGGGAGGPSSQHLLVALRLYVCRNLSPDANRCGPMCQGVPASRCVLTVTRNKQVTLKAEDISYAIKKEIKHQQM